MTLWIEGANLAPVHAEIRLKEAYNYFITPLSDVESDEIDDFVKFGTFLRVPEEGKDLYTFKNNKMIKFGDSIAGLMHTEKEFNDIETWIKSNNLEKISEYISALEIKDLKDLKLHTETIINNAFSDKIINDFEEAKNIRMIFNDIDPCQTNRKRRKNLLVLHFPDTSWDLQLNGEQIEYRLKKNYWKNGVRPIKSNSQYPDRKIEATIKYK